WRCSPCLGELVISYCIHAHDRSIRAAYVDCDNGLFNGTSEFVRAHGEGDCLRHLDVVHHDGGAAGQWGVTTTSLERPDGFSHYAVRDYDELIDHPVVVGVLDRVSFDVSGTPHEFIMVGRHRVDRQRLAVDLAGVCQAQADFWGELPPKRYKFLALIVDQG